MTLRKSPGSILHLVATTLCVLIGWLWYKENIEATVRLKTRQSYGHGYKLHRLSQTRHCCRPHKLPPHNKNCGVNPAVMQLPALPFTIPSSNLVMAATRCRRNKSTALVIICTEMEKQKMEAKEFNAFFFYTDLPRVSYVPSPEAESGFSTYTILDEVFSSYLTWGFLRGQASTH